MSLIRSARIAAGLAALALVALAAGAPAQAQSQAQAQNPTSGVLVGGGLVPVGEDGRPIAVDPGASGRVFHVDYDDGDDGPEGQPNRGLTREAPRRTVPPPEMLGPGDRVLFKGGVRYRRLVRVERSGAPGAPIVYDGNSRGDWGEGRAIIDGAEPLGPWTRAGETAEGLAIWDAPLGERNLLRAGGKESAPLIFQGDVRLALATSAEVADPWAPEDLAPMFLVPRDAATETSVRDAERLRALFAGEGADWRGARVLKHYGNNHLGLFAVEGFDAAAGALTHAPAEMLRTGDVRYALVNHPAVFDSPGEVLVDEAGGRVRLIPLDDADPNVAGLRVAVRGFGLLNLQESHFTVRGFRFAHHTDKGVSTGDWRSSVRHEGVTVEDNLFTQGGGVMILRSDDARVVGNLIEEVIFGQPLFLRQARRAYVARNIARRAPTGITAYTTTDSLFVENQSRETLGIHGNALTIYEGSHRNRFFGNLVLSGRAGFGITLRQSTDLTFAFNVIRGTSMAIAQWAQVDGGDKLDLFNNTFLGTVRLQMATAGKTRMVNNVVATLGMPVEWQEAMQVRAYNVYGAFVDGEAGVRRLREGEMHLPFDQLLQPAPDAPFALRPRPEWRESLSRGAELNMGALSWSHVGAYDAEGRRPDFARLGLTPPPPPAAD